MGRDRAGLVFHLVHGSMVDGWGIRTTIFLKGCPLRCIWCCNPEGQSFAPELRIQYSRCDGCGRCVSACSKGAVSIQEGKIRVDRQRCDGCGACLDACWRDALGQYGTWYTAQEIFPEILKDAAYYDASGGGVTIGGGEATCYPEFCLDLMELCREERIPVAVDSCGYVTTDLGRQVLLEADLVLFDVKGLDPARHKANTGVSNEVILENLRLLDRHHRPVIVRVPMIPNYNAEREELVRTAEFLRGLGCIRRVDLLPYHTFGTTKYQSLDMEYRAESRLIPEETQAETVKLFQSYGLNTQLGG